MKTKAKNQAQQGGKQPFFARLLEAQELGQAAGGSQVITTKKFPSDSDEVMVTLKFPSDSDEGCAR
ncbi:microviridin/marinostatin family tricyclic proteinase inhibitor [Stigmatella aurantiaca]|uniref:Conserved uncharacterized protein n=1 Tax=Stigmatella aurantiaca (strain DW4/3-1) TaxID=378806 RepID=E3FD28_STIAD|nr:microviridin/marinostatin family tricyclic proteinase inhibitor [Stigmatella aurantiaca]ADO75033.1 conserved uncharacterized protein [Stigmatella aurantiaca DW4/3-1]